MKTFVYIFSHKGSVARRQSIVTEQPLYLFAQNDGLPKPIDEPPTYDEIDWNKIESFRKTRLAATGNQANHGKDCSI